MTILFFFWGGEGVLGSPLLMSPFYTVVLGECLDSNLHAALSFN
jgi:hypothetical protein